MSTVSKLEALAKAERKKIDKARKAEPNHDGVYRLESLARHAAEHEALDKVEQAKDPLTAEVLDLLELDNDIPGVY